MEEWHGATIAWGVKDSRTVTVTSADGNQVTISRDHDWGGWLNASVRCQAHYGLLEASDGIATEMADSDRPNWKNIKGNQSWKKTKLIIREMPNKRPSLPSHGSMHLYGAYSGYRCSQCIFYEPIEICQ